MVRSVLAEAERLRIPASLMHVDVYFSDDTPFRDAGVPVAWLWAGNNPTLHTMRDTIAVIQPSELARVGRLAWETLRRARL
jgi:hypothetical protein